MASWIVHLQLAELIYKKMPWLNQTAFYIGNIAIDSGKVSDDGLSVIPSVNISHWTETGKKKDCRFEDFYRTYCLHQKDPFTYSFYLGCVVHLLTDISWVYLILDKAKQKYARELSEDKRFILTIKQDWYDQDFLYLKQHPDFEPLQLLAEVHDFDNQYLPWFDRDAIQLKLDELTAFYADIPNHLDRVYPYLDAKKREDFFKETSSFIISNLEMLKNKY